MTVISTRTLHERWGALAFAVAVAITMGSGCASRSTSTTTSGTPVAVRPAVDAGGGALPTLPPIDGRRPQSFDGAGCRLRADGSSDCSSTADQIAKGEAGASESDWRSLAGFTGRSFTTDRAADAVVVLSPSVTVAPAPDGSWRAIGLVRNETNAVAPAVSVRADLVGADGVVLGQATAVAAVGNVRPGEPVPFEILAPDVPAASVASVAWSAGAAENARGSGSRAFEIATFWTRPAGGRAIESDLHRDNGNPTDHLVFGTVTNVGDAAIGPVMVYAAWLDRGGRVVAMAADAGRSDSGVATSVAPGGFADMLFVVAGSDAAVVAEITPMMWAVAS